MDWTKFSLSTLIGGVAYFFLGWLVYGILLKSVTAMPADMSAMIEYPPEQFKISYMAVSCLVYGALLSLIFIRWANISTFLGGLKAGAIIGFLISLTFGLSMASMFKFASLQNTMINAFAEIVCSGLAGGIIGWFLGRSKN